MGRHDTLLHVPSLSLLLQKYYKMNWTDTWSIAIALEEKFPDVVILSLSFQELQSMVLNLQGFKGTANQCNEKILEAIQQSWLEER